jgi:uncharacterized protein GlcG (DUF336 family)
VTSIDDAVTAAVLAQQEGVVAPVAEDAPRAQAPAPAPTTALPATGGGLPLLGVATAGAGALGACSNRRCDR